MKILIVDDEPLIRLGLLSLAADWGYEALEAGNADEAIAAIERNPEVRLVMTDVDMPGSMDGIRLAHFVRHRWPPIKLVVISGKLAVNASELPEGARFFGKPYQEHKVREAIAELLLEGGGNEFGVGHN
jgi:CheY-like chemotaxis protein